MNTVKILKVALAVATVLTTLGTLTITVWGVVAAQWGLAATCLLLTAGFGYFSYRDYKLFFGPKPKSGFIKYGS